MQNRAVTYKYEARFYGNIQPSVRIDRDAAGLRKTGQYLDDFDVKTATGP